MGEAPPDLQPAQVVDWKCKCRGFLGLLEAGDYHHADRNDYLHRRYEQPRLRLNHRLTTFAPPDETDNRSIASTLDRKIEKTAKDRSGVWLPTRRSGRRNYRNRNRYRRGRRGRFGQMGESLESVAG